MRTIFLISGLLVAAACSNPAVDENTSPGMTPEAPAEATGPFSIALDRSVCFGTCPAYVVEITEDGRVSYCGDTFVKETGERTRQIGAGAVEALREKVQAMDFFALDDAYRAGVTDVPTYIVRVTMDGKTKTVTDYLGTSAGMPDSVRELEAAIDEAAGTAEWIGERPQGKMEWDGQPGGCTDRLSGG